MFAGSKKDNTRHGIGRTVVWKSNAGGLGQSSISGDEKKWMDLREIKNKED